MKKAKIVFTPKELEILIALFGVASMDPSVMKAWSIDLVMKVQLMNKLTALKIGIGELKS